VSLSTTSPEPDKTGPTPLSPGAIVRDAVASFGPNAFTLADLCVRIKERFPKVIRSRHIVSRRLYDLRQGKEPLVEETVQSKDDDPLVTTAYYRYRPPKPKITNPSPNH